MKQLLIICGPTGIGKTKLALHLASKFNGELVSADSRQIYRGMDIGTGKDLPVNSKLQIPNYKLGKQSIGFYEIEGVKIWGYDLVDPTEEFSVFRYVTVAEKIIENISSRGKLPILVGGSGLYIKGVVDGIETIAIPRNMSVRKSLAGKNTDELFEILASLDSAKAASLNVSDKKNPRRLIRAIEIAYYKSENPKTSMNRFMKVPKYETLFIGLTAPRDNLDKRIEKRVLKRLNLGIEDEIQKLLKLGINWEDQSMQSLGYRQWRDYLIHKKTKNEIVEKWTKDEQNYAKRQFTWFNKDKRIIWFDVSKKNFRAGVEKLVKEWHNRKIKS